MTVDRPFHPLMEDTMSALKSLLHLCSLSAVVFAAACGSDVPFEVKDAGAPCGGLEATCSTDGTSLLV